MTAELYCSNPQCTYATTSADVPIVQPSSPIVEPYLEYDTCPACESDLQEHPIDFAALAEGIEEALPIDIVDDTDALRDVATYLLDKYHRLRNDIVQPKTRQEELA